MFGRNGHAQHANITQTVDHFPRNIGLAVDAFRIDVFIAKLSDCSNRFVAARLFCLGE